MAPITRANVNNPELLTWARTAAGYEVEDVARHLGKEPEDVVAWERGHAQPTYRQLQGFAKKVGRAVATLYLPEIPEEPPPPDDYRFLPGSERDEFTPEALLAFREMRSALANLRSLTNATGTRTEFSLSQWSGLDEPADRAVELREAIGITVSEQTDWRHPYEALDAWRWALFGEGVLVQVFQIPIEDVRGFSLIDHGLAGIGLSSQDAVAGRIFSMFHEVGHLCIGLPGVSGEGPVRDAAPSDVAAVERYCDAFSAAFLLPPDNPEVESSMRELADNFTTESALRIGRKFSVSREVVARRVLEADLVSAHRYRELREEWRTSGRRRGSVGGGRHVRTAVSHKGKPFVAIILEAVDTGTVSTFEAAEMLSLRPGHLDEARELAVGG